MQDFGAAFGLAFALDYANTVGHAALKELLVSRSLEYFGNDTEYPAKLEPKRLLAAVLAASGLPASLLSATIRYFVAYWKYFHPQSQVLAPLANLESFTLPEAVKS